MPKCPALLLFSTLLLVFVAPATTDDGGADIAPCPWVVLYRGDDCVALYAQPDRMVANATSYFALYAPPGAPACASAASCPPVSWPASPPSGEAALRQQLPRDAPAYFKLSLTTRRTFSHSVAMRDTPGRSRGWYLLEIVAVEADARARLELRKDFDGCQGRRMLQLARVCRGCAPGAPGERSASWPRLERTHRFVDVPPPAVRLVSLLLGLGCRPIAATRPVFTAPS